MSKVAVQNNNNDSACAGRGRGVQKSLIMYPSPPQQRQKRQHFWFTSVILKNLKTGKFPTNCIAASGTVVLTGPPTIKYYLESVSLISL